MDYFNFDLFFSLDIYQTTSLYTIHGIDLYIQDNDITIDILNNKVKKKKLKLSYPEKYICLFDITNADKILLLKTNNDFKYYTWTNKNYIGSYIVYNDRIYKRVFSLSNILSSILNNDFNNNTFEFFDFILKQKYIDLINNENTNFLFDNIILIKFIVENITNLAYIYNQNGKNLKICNIFLNLRYNENDTNIKNKICNYFIENINNNDYYIDYDRLQYDSSLYFHNFIPIKHNIIDFLKYIVLKYKLMNI